MKIAMFTNTYLPHVGGVARSVSTYEEELRRRGHDVRIVAPVFEGADESTTHVLRTPAVQKFNGSDFSVTIPQPGLIADFLDAFEPDVIHSHHPFLLGDAALRAAWTRRLPIVFTHHTMYEQYTRYVPLDSEALQRVAIQMATEYCNLCTHVIAPSPSIAELLVQRQVTTPISVIPTGIDLELFGAGDGPRFRRRFGLPPDALVVGHVGRLASEKNLDYLARATGMFLARHPNAVLLVVGSGEQEEALHQTVCDLASADRIVMAGKHTGRDLADAYAAMDVFAFSSQSETQGMVLVEAMAARTPVVALDAPGVRDVVDENNGRLLPSDAPAEVFADVLADLSGDRTALGRLGESARASVRQYGLETCADRLLQLYAEVIKHRALRRAADYGGWDRLRARLEIEWNLLVQKTSALAAAVVETEATRTQID
ncbi:MAG: glycosyl transferase family 1 [Planctomycetota bacterium]|nr:MAG: glycosyl transferase family 1 [Planctomycetota bacterium]